MSKKKVDEKTVDATVAEDGKEEDVLTTQNEDEGGINTTPDAPEPSDPEKGPESKKKKATEDERIMAIGKDVPNVSGPSVVMINRAAIIFLAKQLMTPSDLEDFKTLYPSLF